MEVCINRELRLREQNTVVAAPVGEFAPREFRLGIVQFVLLPELQPFLDRLLDGDAIPHRFTFREGLRFLSNSFALDFASENDRVSVLHIVLVGLETARKRTFNMQDHE